MLEFQKKSNELIPALISKFDNYTKNIKNRIKTNSIFSEFDGKTKNELNEFIKLSNARYKGVKIGNDLQGILSYQQQVYNGLSEKILGDNFYSSNEIDQEKRKMFKKTNIKKNSEINILRKQIKQDAKDFSKLETRIRENLEKKVEINRKKDNQYSLIKSRLAHNYKPKFSFEKPAPTHESIISKEDLKEDGDSNKSVSVEEKKKYFQEMLNKDSKYFMSNLSDYSNYLSNIEASHEDGQAMKLVHKFNFLTDDIKLLSYKDEENKNKVEKKKEDPEIDIVKLMRYTERGKQSKWIFPSKQMLQNRANSAGVSTMDKTSSEFRSTRMTVKSEAEKVQAINHTFAKKRQTINNFYKYSDLPRAEEYEGTTRANKRSNLIENLKESYQYNDKPQRSITSSFRKTFAEKTKLWKMQDEELEQKKLNEMENKREMQQFVKKIKEARRIPNYFIDIYSKKDGFTNQRITRFNKCLGTNFNSKKNIEKKIGNFERKMSLVKSWSISKKKQKEHIRMGNEISNRIKHNMKYEDKPEDIDLTYRVFSQKFEGKKSIIIDPYEEFLEFKSFITARDKASTSNATTITITKQTSYKPKLNYQLPTSPTIVKNNSSIISLENNSNKISMPQNENKDMKFILEEKVKETI